MASTNTMIDSAAPVNAGSDATNTLKASRKRLKASSKDHEKAAATSPSPNTRKTTRGSASADVPAASAASDATPAQPRQTKAAAVEALLTREGGASLEALCNATGWQAHTCRAFLSGLRKKGKEVIRASDGDGKSIYLIAPDRSPAPPPAVEQAEVDTN